MQCLKIILAERELVPQNQNLAEIGPLHLEATLYQYGIFKPIFIYILFILIGTPYSTGSISLAFLTVICIAFYLGVVIG
jgi:hypothetical protein